MLALTPAARSHPAETHSLYTYSSLPPEARLAEGGNTRTTIPKLPRRAVLGAGLLVDRESEVICRAPTHTGRALTPLPRRSVWADAPGQASLVRLGALRPEVGHG